MTSSGKFSKLFEPATIGKVKTKNRVVRVAAGTDYVAPGGFLNLEKELPYWEAMARGGVGLAIQGATSIDKDLDAPEAMFYDDKFIPGRRQVVDIVHKYNVPIFIQFMHLGPWVGLNKVSASWISLEELKQRGPEFDSEPHELTIPEIVEIEGTFAAVSERAMKAGYDGVEMNFATCHLGNSFLSRAWNRRQDDYGCQSLENRARFALETREEIKRKVGQDVPVGILINGAEYGIKDGLTIEETRGFAKIFEKAGFDYISVRVFGYMDFYDLHLPDSIFYPEPPEPVPKPLDISHGGAGISVPVAAAIKKEVSIPVITVGKLDAELGEKVLEKGKADFIGLARPLIADPEYPNKVAAGRMEDILPCTRCLSCFGTRVDHGQDLTCRINGAVGGTQDYAVKPAAKKKKVMVVGGGPGGMEAARIAAIRGHDITLYEKDKKLGGLLPLAAMIKGFEVEDLTKIISFYKVQFAKLGVKVKLCTEVTQSIIEQIKPDAVIIATGGIPTVPEIPGIEGRNVLSIPDLHRRVKGYLNFFGPRVLRWLTQFYLPIGKKVIVVGGALQGGEITEFLVKRGRQVTWIDSASTLKDNRLPNARTLRLFRWLDKKDVTMMTEVKYEEVTDKGLTITTKDGKKQTLEADSIIPVMPWAPNTGLAKSLEGKVPEVYLVGDGKEPRLILDAVGEGFRVARDI
jgi:2,4-dienoyl-CoA reductase (NADPH2)